MTIEIVPYNPQWPVEFERIAAEIAQALGDQALCIDHIGSTSVPGLSAKDIIDVQVGVAAFDQRLVERLKGLGYVYRSDITSDHQPPRAQDESSEWEKRFFKSPPEKRPVNLHVRIKGHANQRYALLFRDYLRTHPLAMEAYAELKRQLAFYHPEDLEAYTLIKDPACDLIMAAAEEWARITKREI